MKDIKWWKIGFCEKGEYENRIVIPSFDCDGKLDYFLGRTYSGDYPKYKNPSVEQSTFVFNELMLDFEEPVTLVEGVFDAFRSGRNSIPLLGSSFNRNSRLLSQLVEHDSEVFIALDKDAKKKELRIIKILLEYGLQVKKISLEGFADPSSMPKNLFEKQRNKAIELSQDNILFYSLKEA